jgi:hypothetical protein
MGRGDPIQTPYQSRFGDYQNNAITVTVDFDNTTRQILGALIERDEGCVYSRVLVGLGPDDTPDTTPHQWSVPDGGSTAVTSDELAGHGFTTIEQFMVPQITAAP